MCIYIVQVIPVRMQLCCHIIVLLDLILWAMLLTVWIVQGAINVRSLMLYHKSVLQATTRPLTVYYVYLVVKATFVQGMPPVNAQGINHNLHIYKPLQCSHEAV